MKDSSIKKLIRKCQDADFTESSVKDPEDVGLYRHVTFLKRQWSNNGNGRVLRKIVAHVDSSSGKWELWHVERLGEDEKISLKKAIRLLSLN